MQCIVVQNQEKLKLIPLCIAKYKPSNIFSLQSVVSSPQYPQFLQEAMRVFIKLLQESESQFIAEQNTQVSFHCMKDRGEQNTQVSVHCMKDRDE